MGRYDKILRNYEEHARRIKQSTEIDIYESPDQKKQRITRLEGDYGEWFTYHFPRYAKAPCAPFHIALAKLILKNPVLYVITNWFRGAAKSVHICMGIPLFLMVKGELKFMLLVGQTERKACKLLSDIQIQLKFNQRFINDYGEQFKHGDWESGEFSTKEGIHFMALGVGQSPRGARFESERPDYIVVSDADTKKRCKNPALVKELVEWVQEDLWGCFDQGRERFVVDGNRMSKMSIVELLRLEFIKANQRAKAEGFDQIHHYSRVIAHDRKFKPSWRGKYTSEYWRKKRASRSRRAYHREYLDDPIEEGKVFSADNIIWDGLPRIDSYDALAIYGDLSYKVAGDTKAMRFWGKKGRMYYLIDCFVRNASRRDAAIWLYDLFEDLNNRDNHLNIKVQIEGLFAQDEFVNDFDVEGDDRRWCIPVIPDKRAKGNKYNRIESTTGKYERHWVVYNEKKQNSPDFQEGLDQLLAFEKGSSHHDDAPDADHAAFDLLDRSAHIDNFVPRVRTRSEKRKQKAW